MVKSANYELKDSLNRLGNMAVCSYILWLTSQEYSDSLFFGRKPSYKHKINMNNSKITTVVSETKLEIPSEWFRMSANSLENARADGASYARVTEGDDEKLIISVKVSNGIMERVIEFDQFSKACLGIYSIYGFRQRVSNIRIGLRGLADKAFFTAGLVVPRKSFDQRAKPDEFVVSQTISRADFHHFINFP